MGICSTQNGRSLHTAHSPPIDVIPPDTAFLKFTTLPVLAFYVLISDIKLKKCPYYRIALRFTLEGIDSFTAPLQQPDHLSRVYWKIAHAFDFYMNEYQLRNRFLLVEAIDGRGEVVGMLKMNMYSLWIGPYHMDFKLETSKVGNCRLSFNFKISQGIHIKIRNTFTALQPLQEIFPEEKLVYSIQAIIGQQLQETTCPYVVRVQGQKEKIQQECEDVTVERSNIHWKKQESKPEWLPKFDKKIAYYEIYSSSLHLIFFRLIKASSSSLSSQPAYEMLSQCFIPLRKLMTLDCQQYQDPLTNITYLQRNVELHEKTWLHGKQMGSVRVKFQFDMQSHLKQMQACVRTEDGILASSPLFSQDNTTHDSEEIVALGKLNSEVQKQFINLAECYEHFNLVNLRENVLRINSLLARQLAMLERSSKESVIVYEYKDQMELLKAQRFLIDFAFKAMTYVREDKPDIADVSWSILTAILKRGEFKLSHLGFSKEDRENLVSGKRSSALKMKVDVALKYQQLLNHLLKQTLMLLYCKGEDAQRTFAQSFCAYAYFRIPAFREHILSAIVHQDDPQIPQWRGIQVNLYESQKGTEQRGEDFYGLHFDWQTNFYKPISTQKRHLQHNAQLKIILEQVRWRERLQRRNGAFFSFIQNLVSEIEYVSVVSKYIKWHHLPGYNRLLHAFLVELKRKRVIDYSERMKQACLKLLSNERLLNIFVVLLLQKTNINDPVAVQITVSMIDSFLITLNSNNRPIPSTFDYLFFLEALKIILSSDLEFCISKALLLIYNNLFIFSQQFGLQLCLYLLSGPFFKFFFHWSFNLRHIFHLLVFVRISRYSEQRLSMLHQKHNVENVYTMSLKILIRERLNMLMAIVEKEQPSSRSINEDMFIQRHLYKKMKRKLQDKKNNRQRKTGLQSIEEISLPDLRFTKSLTKGVPSPTKLLYFKDQDMMMTAPKDGLRYVKLALSEYNAMIEQVAKSLEKDPSFTPSIRIKRIIDQNYIGTVNIDEW